MFAQAEQVPFAVKEALSKNSCSAHSPCVLHVNPSVVPVQVPARYCPSPHCALLHVVHVPLSVNDDPLRYSLLPQVGWSLQT